MAMGLGAGIGWSVGITDSIGSTKAISIGSSGVAAGCQ
jgi:hypothetical protein